MSGRSGERAPRSRRSRSTALVLLTMMLVLGACDPASAGPPPAGTGRSLFGGPLGLQRREGQLGRALDVVRIYTRWGRNGPVVDVNALRPLVQDGSRTLLISSSLPWAEWRSEAGARNRDGDPANNVAEPYCPEPALRPGTSTPSGKSWFAAVATGDYDAQLRTWLTTINDQLGTSVEEIYVSLQHEPDRLSDSGGTLPYQRCAGTPEEYRAASARLFQLGTGAVGGGRDLWAGGGAGGKIRFVVIFTTWGFWHTRGDQGAPSRTLVDLATGLPPAGATGDDATLGSARNSPWEPDDAVYDFLATDVFNYSGSVAGGSGPNGVRVDDPATPAKESDQWRMLGNLLASVKRWNANWTTEIGSTRPKRAFITELGSVQDPLRPQRKAQWIADGCRWLSDPANSVFVLANYFDVNQMRLKNWSWTKRDGAWYSSSPTTDDTASIQALATMGRSARFFPGGGACPTA